jgi:hypothetical protein
VIPYLTRSAASGEPASVTATADGRDRVSRLAFFGRLEDKKGVRPFVSGLNQVDPTLLSGVELEFIGKTTTTWTAERIDALLSAETRRSLRRVSFQTELEQHEALARLAAPGTLAVMPSLGDNSPNTVYECLERRIPFIASAVGGIPELIAPDDRGRVLFEPTSDGVADKLQGALSDGAFLRPAEPAFNATASLAAWADVIETTPERRPPAVADAAVDVLQGASAEQARTSGLLSGDAPFVLLLNEDDRPDAELVATLMRAQAASGADVVTCGLRLTNGDDTLRFFSGDPRGLGAVWNDYGTVGLIRRALLEQVLPQRRSESDPDWPLLAALAADGARIVSVPLPLVTRAARPGTVEDSPSDALLVLEQLERAVPPQLRLVGRLAAGLVTLDAGKHEPGHRGGWRALLRRGRASR